MPVFDRQNDAVSGLGCAENTVKIHITRLYKKCSVDENVNRSTRLGLKRFLADALYKRPEIPRKKPPAKEQIPAQLQLNFNKEPLADLFGEE